MTYDFQVSNHPHAGARIPSEEAASSWQSLYAGTVATDAQARRAVDGLSMWYRHARVFKTGKSLGRMLYAVLRT